ncbi:DNA primase [Streptomyces sp. UG1]|uniref:DNA primase n=1 Tax=Streptomyces sp. UG1 TaxID=3417652 RepID=UPI003CF805FC
MNTRTCERCGEHLRARHSHRARFCSTRCRVAAHREKHAIPAELRARERWVRRSSSKVPLRSDTGRPASSTDPATWTTYAAAAASPHGSGLGFVLAHGDGIVVLDLDHCLVDGEPKPWAREILERCPATYVEVSVSGEGLHLWGRGRIGRGRRIRWPDGAHIEIYSAERFIVLGERYRHAPLHLADLSDLVAELA